MRHAARPAAQQQREKYAAYQSDCVSAVQDTPAEPLLAFLHHTDGSAAAPLEALCIARLASSIGSPGAFSGTLRHLVLAKLPWETAYVLSYMIGRQKARICPFNQRLLYYQYINIEQLQRAAQFHGKGSGTRGRLPTLLVVALIAALLAVLKGPDLTVS